MARRPVETPDTSGSRLTAVQIDECPVCGASDKKPLGAVLDSLVSELDRTQIQKLGAWTNEVVECADCRVAYLNPRADSASLRLLYRLWYEQAYSNTPSAGEADRARAAEFEEYHLARIKRSTGMVTGRVLDVGTGTGVFVEVAQAAGWCARGIDSSPTAVTRAKSAGRKVERGLIEQVASGGERFDLITMFDMLEHTETPVRDLLAARASLNRDGFLAVRVPNRGGLQSRLMGLGWVGVMSLHLTYFDRGSMERLLRRCGFEIVAVNAGNYQSLATLLTKKADWIRRRLGLRKPEQPAAAQGDEQIGAQTPVSRRPIAFLVGSIWELLDHFGGWIGQGNQLFVVARPARASE